MLGKGNKGSRPKILHLCFVSFRNVGITVVGIAAVGIAAACSARLTCLSVAALSF